MQAGTKLLSFASLALVALPGAARAQEPRPMYELPSITVMAPSEADPLYETASALYQAGDWEGAAVVYRNAAEAMPKNDPNSYTTFDQSARLYFYAGKFSDARDMMEKTAGVAEATGDLVSAAYRHVDAAFIAVWEGYPGKRREHVQVAEQYAAGEGFTKSDADRVRALTRGVGALPVEEDE
jgi:tetratricopeptide (TPR) repeat protein